MKKLLFLFAFVFAAVWANALTYYVTVPEGTNACYIAGDMNGWNHQEMKMLDPTHYTLEIPTATIEQKYKYCSGPRWGYVEETSDGNDVENRSYSPNDVVAKWSVTYDKSIPDKVMVYNVTVPAGTKKCYIGGGWDGWANFLEMKKVDATHFRLNLFSNPQLKYYYYSGPNWENVEVAEDGKGIPKRSYAAEDVVAKWYKADKPMKKTSR